MKLTREECFEALDYILENKGIACITVRSKRMLEQLINEHFDNLPLKFKELHENMWVWDNKDKQWCKYLGEHVFEYLDGYGSEFEENRFYRKQVK